MMPGVSKMIGEVQVEGTFLDGTKLVGPFAFLADVIITLKSSALIVVIQIKFIVS